MSTRSPYVMAYDRPIDLYEVIWPCTDCPAWHIEIVPDPKTLDEFNPNSRRGPEVIMRVWHNEDCPSWERR